jgi:hypothetical protein
LDAGWRCARRSRGRVEISVGHPRIEERQASGFEGILRRFLDDHELSPTGVFLVKRLGG